MLPNEPNQITEVRGCGFIPDKLQHVRILHPVHVQRNGAHRDTNHGFRMVEELDCFGVEREVVRMLVVEEVYRVRVQLQTQRLEEQYVVAHHIFVGKVELVDDYGVYEVVTKEVIYK